jgi:site-specific DNA-methyltransferase (adenine-specific)
VESLNGKNGNGTSTSSFGVGKRESHDSSKFYEKRMYDGIFSQPLDSKELKSIETPELGDWSNKIFCKSSESMDDIPDNSIALAVTSPPYNASKDDEDLSLDEYLGLISRVGREVYRVLRPGGRYAINIANLGRKPYIPLTAFFYQIHIALNYLPMGEIIWQKAKGASGSTAWGSWKSAKSPRLRDLHEYILVFAKHSFSRPDKGESDIEKEDFMSATLSIWEIPPESAKKIGHPAPFPVALIERLIKLYTYTGDVVLDPFLGSGTSAIAAINASRNFVGYELNEEYVELANNRIKNETGILV